MSVAYHMRKLAKMFELDRNEMFAQPYGIDEARQDFDTIARLQTSGVVCNGLLDCIKEQYASATLYAAMAKQLLALVTRDEMNAVLMSKPDGYGMTKLEMASEVIEQKIRCFHNELKIRYMGAKWELSKPGESLIKLGELAKMSRFKGMSTLGRFEFVDLADADAVVGVLPQSNAYSAQMALAGRLTNAVHNTLEQSAREREEEAHRVAKLVELGLVAATPAPRAAGHETGSPALPGRRFFGDDEGLGGAVFEDLVKGWIKGT
jgi:hypothetical protein